MAEIKFLQEKRSMEEILLLTAGPTPLSEQVRKILSQPMIYHRDQEFISIFNRLSANLTYLFQTKNDVLILTCSGSGAMEAGITNFFSPGDNVLVIENGKFSERWSQIAERYQLMVNRLQIPWGKSVSANQIRNKLATLPQQQGIFLAHCETSTGALTDLETIVPEIRKRSSALIVVDAITSAAILPLKVDRWGIDVAIAASQKGLGLPPGLAMITVNERAWRLADNSALPKYYLDVKQARQALNSGRGTAFTPAIPLILAADVVLQQLKEKGLEKIWEQRQIIAENFRRQIADLGLPIFPEKPAASLTVFKIGHLPSCEKLVTKLKDQFNIFVSGGQGQLVNKVIRVGHMANVGMKELNRFFEAFQIILSQR
jgi:aspartate aminotransferase-like enzyme